MDSSYLPFSPQTKCWPLQTAGLKSGIVVGYLPHNAFFKTHEICSQNTHSLWALLSARASGNVSVVIKNHVDVMFSYFFCFAVERRVGAWPPS